MRLSFAFLSDAIELLLKVVWLFLSNIWDLFANWYCIHINKEVNEK